MKIAIKSKIPFEYGTRTKSTSIITIEIEKFEFKCESGFLEIFITDKTESGELIYNRSIVYTNTEVDDIFQNFGSGIQQNDSYVNKTKEILLAALLYTIGTDGSYNGTLNDWEIFQNETIQEEFPNEEIPTE